MFTNPPGTTGNIPSTIIKNHDFYEGPVVSLPRLHDMVLFESMLLTQTQVVYRLREVMGHNIMVIIYSVDNPRKLQQQNTE